MIQFGTGSLPNIRNYIFFSLLVQNKFLVFLVVSRFVLVVSLPTYRELLFGSMEVWALYISWQAFFPFPQLIISGIQTTISRDLFFHTSRFCLRYHATNFCYFLMFLRATNFWTAVHNDNMRKIQILDRTENWFCRNLGSWICYCMLKWRNYIH